MNALLATSFVLAALAAIGPLVADGTTQEVTGTVGTVGQLGIGAWLLAQIRDLTKRVGAWLDSLDAHHKSVREHQGAVEEHNAKLQRRARELLSMLRRIHGIPEAVVRDFTPAPRDVDDEDEASPGRRRGVDPR